MMNDWDRVGIEVAMLLNPGDHGLTLTEPNRHGRVGKMKVR